jgi:DeoR/GlpR family transcriptional regulator of sugar metabolism
MESVFMGNDRQQKILEILAQKGEVQLQQLQNVLPDVSQMTLRRDLISLENEGYLIRTYGGAVSTKRVAIVSGEEDAYARRAVENIEAKMKIAEKAVSLVEKGRSIYFDAGSTVMCLANQLPDENFTIVTSGANIALELLKKHGTSVVMLGGLINLNTLSVSGPNAIAMLETINIDIAFMSASGFSLDSGLTVSNVYESELKRKIVSRSQKVVLLLDTHKINKNTIFTYADLKDIDVLVAEGPLPSEVIHEAEKYGVQII